MRKLTALVGIGLAVACSGRSTLEENPPDQPSGTGGSGSDTGHSTGGRKPVIDRPSAGSDSTGTGGQPGGAGGVGGASFPGGGPASGGASPAGAGGLGGGSPDCTFPAIDVELAPWKVSKQELTPDENFARISAGMVGAWYGFVTTPWLPAYEVTARFDADGRYSAACVFESNECCVAFYYGTDDDADIKVYELTEIMAEGAAGSIDIAFGSDDTYVLPAWQGELRHVDVDATGDRLRFQFYRSDGYGPIVFSLARSESGE